MENRHTLPNKTCPECGGGSLYMSKPTAAAGGYGPNLLPGLGWLFSTGKFRAVVCADCGYARYFATAETCARLAKSSSWTPL
jgi:predicted nucleic-acid-binding Zn-ribbon protein